MGEFNKCRFCWHRNGVRAEEDNEPFECPLRVPCHKENLTFPTWDTNKIIQVAKEKGLSVSDVIALIKLVN